MHLTCLKYAPGHATSSHAVVKYAKDVSEADINAAIRLEGTFAKGDKIDVYIFADDNVYRPADNSYSLTV